MRLQSRVKEEPEINLTSLIDVVFLLLIFFMVSSQFVKHDRSVELPLGGEGVKAAELLPETIELVVIAFAGALGLAQCLDKAIIAKAIQFACDRFQADVSH